jgi:DNA-binding response OmpR family regulator
MCAAPMLEEKHLGPLARVSATPAPVPAPPPVPVAEPSTEVAADPFVPVQFGRFTVARHRRELLVDGRPADVGGRAFDTLVALLDARGSLVERDVLMRQVWPDRVVEDNNLEAQISALRKVLGADRDLIKTVPGRGYQFIGVTQPPTPAS